MSTIAEIRHHIRVVDDTRKITRAMYMIASAKMQKGMRMMAQNHPYFARVRSDIRYILENADAQRQNPYFRLRAKGRAAYIVVGGDKGMCGSYNTDIIRLAERTIAQPSAKDVRLFAVGNVVAEYFATRRVKPDFTYQHVIQNPTLHMAREIAMGLVALYDRKRLDEIYIIYTRMLSTMQLQPTALRLLPVLESDFMDVEILHEHEPDVIYHPSASGVLNALVPQYLVGLVYTCLVHAFASEHSARMMAMDASTRNADEMLHKLKLDLNRARQTQVTQEIVEIMAGVNAMQNNG